MEWLRQLEADEELPTVLREVLGREVFRRELLSVLNAEEEQDLRKLRQLAMGIWLNMVNAAALDERGTLMIKIRGAHVELEPSLDESEFFIRQAILRQIERYTVARENGLFEREWNSILDIGAGGLALEATLREGDPNARILAFEPGLITKKTKSVAQALQVELRQEELTADQGIGDFDLVLLHFVLEHDLKEAEHLLRQALERLKPGGIVSVAVPNFDAKHRALDLENRLNDRDQETRLSIHDRLSGHEILFTQKQLQELIEKVVQSAVGSFHWSTRSILPRESAFNVMAARGEHRKFLELSLQGHKKNEEGQGSVLVAKIEKLHH